jgi:hypothetical protein
MVGLSLVAVFAIAAIAATSASALPEWGKCAKIGAKGGKYTDSNCTKKAKKNAAGEFLGEYEWKKGKEIANVPFTGASVGSGGVLYAEWAFCREGSTFNEFLGRHTRAACQAHGASFHRVHEGFPTVECTAENSSGEASGTNSVLGVHVTFTGCKAFGVVPCENVGPEEVKTNELKGKLGYLNKAAKEAGVLLEPAKKHGTFAEFTCPGLEVGEVVGGGNIKEGAAHTTSGCTQECPTATPEEEKFGGYDGVISPITPVNVMTSTFTQEYKVVGSGSNETCPENVPNKFQGKHIDLLENYPYAVSSGPKESGMWGCSGEEITNVNTPSEPGEIKA